ncbi:MAG: CHASE2 domain-containing protein [Proteobacteria bacterium]|nr:CHASE2 domain-containing protein [Pseudomonadota bacterium]
MAWWALFSQATAGLDLRLLDHAATHASPPSDALVIVGIDERSLATVGRWPWDRRQLAALVDRLHAAGARAVALDVLLSEPSPDPAADAALGAAIARAGNVVLPYGFTLAEGRSGAFTPLPPVPALARGAAGLGHVVLRPDGDGVVRRVPLQLTLDGTSYPHLQQVLFTRIAPARPAPGASGAEPAVVPLRPAGAYRSVPASAVIDGSLPDEMVRGRIVLVGATAAGLGDLYSVPAGAGGVMNGVEIQANLYQALAENSFIRPLPTTWAALVAALVLLALFAGFWRLSPRGSLVLASLLALAVPLASLALAGWARLWLAPGPIVLALALAYPLWGWRRLDAVSAFLGAKAAVLGPPPARAEGFDALARQVGQLDMLIDEVAGRREFLQRVIDAAPDALCVFDRDHRLLLLNPRAETLFGRATGATLETVLAGAGGRLDAAAGELQLADGRIFALTEGISDGHRPGPALGELHILRLTEVTAIRRAEAERREMLEFLSHDMRGPQVAILGLAEGADAPGQLGRIRDHARRTLDLADTFVQLARLDHAAPQWLTCDMAALLDEAADRAWTAARARGAKVEVGHDGEPVELVSDPALLARLFDNLIGNAIKYGRDGGTVRLGLHADEAISVSVADDGPGLPESRRADPFRRFGSTGGGAGLGLAFVAAAVARLGGTVACASGPDGTSFTIRLPRAPAGDAA